MMSTTTGASVSSNIFMLGNLKGPRKWNISLRQLFKGLNFWVEASPFQVRKHSVGGIMFYKNFGLLCNLCTSQD